MTGGPALLQSFEWRPPELVPGVAAGLAMLSLAEAQAVTAHRAEQRGSGPALVAALHVGTAGEGPRPAGSI